ncbi:peptidoglycan-binding domain-containing protein [uncultured Massilia sp.]|uniref:peptidoglycan-binding domain-containing protein n=1 Tax=uncultured Massilia sp. TaxID=169973 RepID=UPI0025F9ECF9|nr:peptidoglycan-binding domain-containing protein [uncultured Massilia sp.]
MPDPFDDQPAGTSVQPCPYARQPAAPSQWLEIELVGEDGGAVPWEEYAVFLPDGTQASGFLDGDGFARLAGLADGASFGIVFPQLDRDALAFVEALGPRAHPGPATGAAEPHALLPAGAWHTVAQGENIESIAYACGHFSPTVWEHPANAALKARRGDANVLQPGDKVFVPPLRTPAHDAAGGRRHRFRRRGVPSIFRFRALVAGHPLAGQPYVVEVDGEPAGQERRGSTDADGMLACFVRPDAPRARVAIGSAPLLWTFEVSLRTVDPITQASGIQARLANLGYAVPAIDGTLDDATHQALLAFQAHEGLEQTGEPDQPTRTRLQAVHGS